MIPAAWWDAGTPHHPRDAEGSEMESGIPVSDPGVIRGAE